MKKIFFLSLILFVSLKTFAQQTDKDAVKQTINTMFDAMRKGDSTLLRSTFHKNIVFEGVANKKDGTVDLNIDNPNDFIKAVGTPHKEMWDEQVAFNDIKIDGDLASVWMPYKFYLGKTFSHCGVDVFQLMRTPAGWKIIYVVDTRRKGNCPE
ncbi:nuclear transport factor 2 family protein [Mucilaginibacter sp. FT3.2]|uniref:nuclear transport factor 2 family protein n=1 Tax=Mucilaginibacter sp. FT3.2 TaxID=2723090 RepID=UPI00161432FB|nr:nuclear transport factor 2 family protein [Mucilaginibacter sp. FT3.2]MBB6235150.1 preprotein translocase subunit YajC [Mucilaginibacter sp. FT3.2]